MAKVSECVHLLEPLFDAVSCKDTLLIEEIAVKISLAEHQADLTKNDIRNHLPKSLFLPIDRGNLLEILSIQDHLADTAEDLSVLVTLKPLDFTENLGAWLPDFHQFLRLNIQAFDQVHLIIKELHELLETSFGGIEAEKVRLMVEKVAYLEHEVDEIQHKLLKGLYQNEEKMSFGIFFLWQKIFSAIGNLSNSSEKLAYRVRTTLELK